MTFIYRLDPYTLEIYQMCKYELSTSKFSEVIIWHTHIHTQRHDWNYIPCRSVDGQLNCYIKATIVYANWLSDRSCKLQRWSNQLSVTVNHEAQRWPVSINKIWRPMMQKTMYAIRLAGNYSTHKTKWNKKASMHRRHIPTTTIITFRNASTA